MIRFESKLLNKLETSFIPQLNERLAEFSLSQVQEEFNTTVDPYDEIWEPHKEYKGYIPHALLYDTGTLYDGFEAYAMANGRFVIKNNTPYAHYLQDGTTKMVARKTLPDKGRLPTKWKEGYITIFQDILENL